MNNKQQMYQNYMMNNNNGTKDNKNLIMGHHPKNQMRSSLHTNTMSNPIQNNSIPFMDNTQLNGANRFYPNDMMRPSGFQSVENIPFNYPEGNDGYFGHSGTFPGTMSVGSVRIRDLIFRIKLT